MPALTGRGRLSAVVAPPLLAALCLLPLALGFNGGPLLAPTRHRTVVASAALQEPPLIDLLEERKRVSTGSSWPSASKLMRSAAARATMGPVSFLLLIVLQKSSRRKMCFLESPNHTHSPVI